MTEKNTGDQPVAYDISVCLCTFKRPALLEKCLQSLLGQEASRRFEVVLVDNDTNRTAEAIAKTFFARFENRGSKLRYSVEPEQNIAIARNRAVSLSTGKYIAFIDDDEDAQQDWLEKLCDKLECERVDGVFGAVVRLCPRTIPECLIKAGFFEDPRANEASSRISGARGRTNNAIITRTALKKRPGPFDDRLGRTGGSDTELFLYLENQGCVFYWCPQAMVREYIGDQRATLAWQFRRAYRSGWLRAKLTTDTHGTFLAVCYLLPQIFLGFTKAVLTFFLNFINPKIAVFKFVRILGSQLGKLGSFLGIRVIEYKG